MYVDRGGGGLRWRWTQVEVNRDGGGYRKRLIEVEVDRG